MRELTIEATFHLHRGKSLTLLYQEQGLLSRGACEQWEMDEVGPMEGVAKWYD